MSDLAPRPATVNDAGDIHTLLLALAGDIPLAVEALEQEEALYAQLRKTLAWGESWVAETEGRIVGAVVVDNVQTGRHWGEHETLEVRYAAGEGLNVLIAQVLDRTALVTAAVKDANRTALAATLERLGFREDEGGAGDRRFRRDP